MSSSAIRRISSFARLNKGMVRARVGVVAFGIAGKPGRSAPGS